MNGDEAWIRKQATGVMLEAIASDWEWLDAIAGKFSDDFFALGRQQPDLPPQPELDGLSSDPLRTAPCRFANS